jgi:hypothetical protein
MTVNLSERISFDALVPGMAVRSTDDGHMLALDFISTLTGNDRKKASQTLARVVVKPDTAGLFTLRQGRRTPRKLISLANAFQLLLILPKRTVSMDVRRAVAVVLAGLLAQQPRPAEKRRKRHHLIPPDALDVDAPRGADGVDGREDEIPRKRKGLAGQRD